VLSRPFYWDYSKIPYRDSGADEPWREGRLKYNQILFNRLQPVYKELVGRAYYRKLWDLWSVVKAGRRTLFKGKVGTIEEGEFKRSTAYDKLISVFMGANQDDNHMSTVFCSQLVAFAYKELSWLPASSVLVNPDGDKLPANSFAPTDFLPKCKGIDVKEFKEGCGGYFESFRDPAVYVNLMELGCPVFLLGLDKKPEEILTQIDNWECRVGSAVRKSV
jgi:hypothetical protein